MRLFRTLALAAAMLASPALADDQPASVRITYVASPFNVPSIVMREKGYLDEAFAAKGIKVESPEITSGAQQTQAIAAGEIDIASVLGGTSAILAKANGVDLQIIAAYARSPKAYFLMTRGDGPATLADLKGKKVAGPKGTVLNQLLVAALAEQGLTLKDIEYINMDLPTARAALLSGQVDVATLAGANAVAVEKAGGKPLTSGEGLIKPTTVIAARSAFLKEHPDLVEAYFDAHYKALAFMKEHPDEALAIAAKEQKISLEDAKAQMPLYDFTPVMTEDDVANLTADQDFMIEAGMLPKANALDIKVDLIAPMAFETE
ncbi:MULTISPECIES: ABC transporter substrate-binding protein [Alphaproteobacteria]|uniref:ABC transporter substrate-binding protein n=2 Tax=Alphaproteobacteria TaxID=28211 RepID=A0A512HPI8_9HYPH|nr:MULTISPECIES: NrtA/SsuA/CpmA family ABC transporter substrate-binding protein [Alphaproteobacteria]GEO87351.1 ABC transporter substrate-binding protein [Ciceribacter naphthalenivorans]GLR24037.1 ABC transporter substrate-binding protein [Ciceribacter naphthalenivorans]GLT06893.1 ABC transporter substrate-binding protein [Sphingomonas psychrolutea]